MIDVFNEDEKYIMHSYNRFPVAIVKGYGSRCWDIDGKEYIDFTSGIGVNSLGFCNKQWVKEVSEQAAKLNHISNCFFSEPGTKLAKEICEKTGYSKVFFNVSGAEANETAIKSVRRYSFDKHGSDDYSNIIVLKNSFHGRTITTLSATGQDFFHEKIGPMTSGFIFVDPNSEDDLEQTILNNKICAIMFELIQGESGVNPLSKTFVQRMVALAQKNDLLLIDDEVQTGNGRTGKLFSYMNYQISPDIITTAKGLGGGLPISCAIFNQKLSDIYTPGTNGSTFGMNPIACSGALEVLRELDDGFLHDVEKKGIYIRKEISFFGKVKSISGMGLMVGIECHDNNALVAKRCIDNGLLVLTAGDKIRLLPPLNISWEDLTDGIKILKRILD